MEQEVKVEAEAEVEAEGAGERMASEKGSEGWQVSSCLFLKECHWVCIKAGFKKASSINDLFISEVKSREG